MVLNLVDNFGYKCSSKFCSIFEDWPPFSLVLFETLVM